MTIGMFQLRENSLFDDALTHYPDGGESLAIDAMRTWFRPQCDAVRGKQTWQEVLGDGGMSPDGISCFDMLMMTWVHTSSRTLDIRCRCSTELSNDEASLLQTIGHFQSTDEPAAKALLSAWFSASSIDQLSNVAHWFSLALIDAGIAIRTRTRRVTYSH